VDAAATLARLAVELGVDAIDLGGGHPAAPAVSEHARAVTAALRRQGFDGRLLLEPGRAIVTDAVDLAMTVVAVKELDDGTRCASVDAGTNLLPGALWSWPAIEALERGGPTSPMMVTGPLCLNVDVLHPAAELPQLAPGDLLLARAVGAYHQSQSTQFGDLRPAVAARDHGDWRLVQRSETVGDLIAGGSPEEVEA
jgi:diaminopimelate decarboxylase